MFDAWFLPRRLRVVIVNLKSNREVAYRGVLFEQRGPWLFLRNAEELHADDSPPSKMDGEVMVHRDNVEFLQVY